MTITTISAQQAAQWLSSGEAVLVDVREPEEFKAEHIAYATSLPLGSVRELFPQLRVPENTKIIFQCMKGGRGQQACVAVGGDAAGYDVYNIEGGIKAWKEAGFPVISSAFKTAGISVFRQVQMIAGLLVALFVVLGFSGLILGFVLAGFLGAMLFFAGLTGWCGLAMLLNRMPWNRK